MLWLLPDRLGSGDWLRSLRRAQATSPHDRALPFLDVVRSAFEAMLVPITVGAALAMRLTPESVSTMRASGPRNPGDSACVGSQIRLGPDAQKHRGAPDRSGTPLCIPLNGSTTRSSDRL